MQDGSLLAKGKQVTGFSNEEEQLGEVDKFVPFLTESELLSRPPNSAYATVHGSTSSPRTVTLKPVRPEPVEGQGCTICWPHQYKREELCTRKISTECDA